MDFKDWRKAPNTSETEQEPPKVERFRGRRYYDYVEEQIREAQERGEFDNLQGSGKPLHLDDNPYLGDKAMAYGLLKSNQVAPAEIELAKEIRTQEKRAYNASVEKAAAEYERTLRELNSKILTLNLIAPPAMHQPLLEVEKLVQGFREACPLL